jgi:hypothetical protein
VIRANDRIELASGVSLQGGYLVDEVRDVRIRLNPTAAVALQESTPAQMAVALCSDFAVARPRADVDVLTLSARLNAALLANVSVATPRLLARWLLDAFMLLPLRRAPCWPARRRALSTSSVAGAIATVTRGTAATAVAVSVATALPLAAVGAHGFALAAGIAAGTGLVLHEVAHAVALRGVAAALIVRGIRVSLLHRRLDRRREGVVAAAGPLAVVAAALVALALVHAFAAAFAAPIPVIFALHALGLTVLGPDGRKLCALS